MPPQSSLGRDITGCAKSFSREAFERDEIPARVRSRAKFPSLHSSNVTLLNFGKAWAKVSMVAVVWAGAEWAHVGVGKSEASACTATAFATFFSSTWKTTEFQDLQISTMCSCQVTEVE